MSELAVRKVFRGWSALALAAALVAGFAACGGGGGGGGGPTEPPPPTSGLTFTPAGGASGAAVLLTRQGTDPNVLVLEVAARDVSGLYGLYFDLGYPSAALSFDSASEGTFLSSGGATSLQVSATQAGNLVVGLTRLGAASGASGSGTLLTLRFRAVATGSGGITFSRNQGVAANGSTLGDLSWFGGSVQVTR